MRSNIRIFFMLMITCVFLEAEEVQVEESSSTVEEVVIGEGIDKGTSQLEKIKVKEINEESTTIPDTPPLKLSKKVENTEEESSLKVEEVVEKGEKKVSQFEEVKVKEITSNPLLKLIEKVKEAKGEERRTLMNTLKLELRAMNKEKRQETMKQIKHSLGKNDIKEEHKTQSRHKSQMREHQHQRHQPQFRPMHGGMGTGYGGNH